MSELLERVEEGREHLRNRRWREGYDLLTPALDALTAEDLEQLAWAAFFTKEVTQAAPLLERAFSAYLAEGNETRAAFIASQLAHEYGSVRLQKAIGSGWMARAERLLEGKPEGVAHGYIALQRGLEATKANDWEAVRDYGAEAERIGREFSDLGLELRGRQRRAVALIYLGDVEEGRLLLNEVNTAAYAGTIGPYDTVVIYCNAIGTCRDVAAFDEASQWTERADLFCNEQAIDAFPGVCRVNRAEVMRFEGKLEAAEQAAAEATQLLASWAPRIEALGHAEVGEARLRLGDLSKAQEAFDRADALGHDPEPGNSLLLLAREKPAAAFSSIRRALTDDQPPLTRARLLPAFVEIAVAAGSVDAAGPAAEELTRIAEQYDTPALHAAAACASGTVLLAQGDSDGAIRPLRRALRLWQETNARYEAARTRVLIARAYRESGDEHGALHELAQAGSAFDQLGARLDSERVDEMLGRAVGRTVTQTFAFTDIVDSTRHLEREGDAKWQSLLALHDRIVRNHVSAVGGIVVDHTGDGFFLAFDEPADATAATIAIQREVCTTFHFEVRIGLHRAEAIQIGENYRGKGVHAAARIGALAGAAEIVASLSSLEDLDVRHGEPRSVELKGLEAPVDVVTLEWRDAS
jgi:class 3 adenylate cyclase